MQSVKKIIELKSHNSNYILNISTDDYYEAIEHIRAKFENEEILRDITINYINADKLSVRHIDMIKDYLRDELDVDYQEVLPGKKISTAQKDNNKKYNDIKLRTVKDDTAINTVNPSKPKATTLNRAGKTAGMEFADVDEADYRTKIIRHSMRSGSSEHYDGNIMVIGDVNAGAELVASGSIIVFGVLRGVARAGVKGDRETMIIADKIVATQLRIAECIAIPPKDDKSYYTGTQMAIIRNDVIEIQQIN